MMKKAILCLLVAALILMEGKVPVFAQNANENTVESKYNIEKAEIDEQFLVCKYERPEINEASTFEVRNSSLDKGDVLELLTELNFPEEKINNYSEEELLQLAQCEEIYTATTYALEVDGVVTYSSDFREDLVESFPGPIDYVVKVDSYQKITLMLYDDPETDLSGYYLLSASVEWLIMPEYRLTDAFGITAREISVLATADYYPDAEGFYQFTRNGEKVRHDFTAGEIVRVNDNSYYGVGAKFALPQDNTSQETIAHSEGFFVSLEVRVRVLKLNSILNTNIVASYVHAYIQLSPQQSVTMDAGGSDTSILGAITLTGTQASNDTYAAMSYTYTPD